MNAESNSSSSRPTFNELLDFAEGRLAGSEHQRVAAFLAEHSEAIAADWAWVEDFLRKTRAVELHPMPAGLEDRLNSLYRATPALSPSEEAIGWVETIRRVVAELVDPGVGPAIAVAGLRSKAFENAAQQWAYKSGEFDILVNALVRPDQCYDLHGQVFPLTEEAGDKVNSAQLVRGDREFGLVVVDAFGEFLISGVPAGEYTLVIAGEDIEVVCTPVTLVA